ncbi:MAG: YHS domain-containing (seleno)protein [Acidobacteriota bacterium]
MDENGVALRGFDAVAYFAVENAVKGDGKYEYVWKGAKWLFSTEENMRKFQANPDMYAPQFGGYCSYAVSKGYTANGDPEAWKIVKGKLYLNYSPEVKKLWEQDQDTRISDGVTNWTEFKTRKPEHKG